MKELERLTSELPCSNYLAFVELAKVAAKNTWGNKAVFISAYPEKDIDVTPIITHRIEVREPSAIGKGTREIKPRIRYQGTTDKGERYQLVGQMFDYHIRFDIWASTGEEADKTVLELETMLYKYTGYFKKNGVSEFIFERQINDTESRAWRADLVNRTLIYYLRLDETKVIMIDTIDSIDISATTVSSAIGEDLDSTIIQTTISNNSD